MIGLVGGRNPSGGARGERLPGAGKNLAGLGRGGQRLGRRRHRTSRRHYRGRRRRGRRGLRLRASCGLRRRGCARAAGGGACGAGAAGGCMPEASGGRIGWDGRAAASPRLRGGSGPAGLASCGASPSPAAGGAAASVSAGAGARAASAGLFRRLGLARLPRYCGFPVSVPEDTAQAHRYVFVDRAGMGLLFGDPQFGEPVKDFVRLDFQLPRQLINANLLHKKVKLLLVSRRAPQPWCSSRAPVSSSSPCSFGFGARTLHRYQTPPEPHRRPRCRSPVRSALRPRPDRKYRAPAASLHRVSGSGGPHSEPGSRASSSGCTSSKPARSAAATFMSSEAGSAEGREASPGAATTVSSNWL